jgi:hypothetical protein
MLRIVHPAPSGQGIDPPKRRKGSLAPTLSISPTEAQHFRAALRNAARAYGATAALAAAMGVPVRLLYRLSRARFVPSGIVVIRFAAAAQTTVEAVLSGALGDAGKCPTCGARIAGGRA